MATPNAKLNPYRDPRPFQKVRIGNVELPGVLTDVTGVSKPENWVIQMGIQVSHAITIWRGTKLAENISLTCQLPDEASFDGYWEIRNVLRPKLGSRPPALVIVNAIFNFAGVTRVSVRDVIPPKPAAGNSWVGEIQLIEFNPPKIAPVGPPDPPKAKSENDLLAEEFVKQVGIAKQVSGL